MKIKHLSLFVLSILIWSSFSVKAIETRTKNNKILNSSGSKTLVDPCSLVITGNLTHESCNTLNDGAIDITITGGSGQYSYEWEGPDSFVSQNEDISGLNSGMYSVTVTDINDLSCIKIEYFSISETNYSVSMTGGFCFGDNITFNCTPSINQTVYSNPLWSFGDGNTSNLYTEDYIYANGGNYIATFNATHNTDPSCNLSIQSVIEVIKYTFSSSSSNLTVGQSVTFTYTGISGSHQNPGYSYYKHKTGDPLPPDLIYEATDLIGYGDEYIYSFDQPGEYEVTLNVNSKGDGCPHTVIINVVCGLSIESTSIITNESCNTLNDGGIDITVIGGTTPYSYSWLGPDGYTSNIEDITGLHSGTYNITVTDANNCMAEAEIIVGLFAETINPTVLENCIGEASNFTFSPNLSQTLYSFNWDFGDDNFSTGYNPEHIYISGGEQTYSFNALHNANALCNLNFQSTIQIINPLFEANDYSLTVGQEVIFTYTGEGGSADNPGYSIVVNNNIGEIVSSSNVIQNGIFHSYIFNQPGTYDITLQVNTLRNTCDYTITVTVCEVQIESSIITNESCNTMNDGSVSITVIGGTTPYSYSWLGPDGFTFSSKDITNIKTGQYNLTVTDADNCSVDYNAFVDLLPVSTGISGAEICLGEITSFNVQPDLNPDLYSFSWNFGDGSAISTVYEPEYTYTTGGVFNVTFDATNNIEPSCSISTLNDNVFVSDPSFVISDLELCLGQQVDFEYTGNGSTSFYPGYSYLINHPGQTPVPIFTSPGFIQTGNIYQYTFTQSGIYEVTLMLGSKDYCSKTFTVTVSDLSVAAVAFDAHCSLASDGSVQATVTGGASPVDLLWQNGETTEILYGLMPNTYTVTATDETGCTATSSAVVSTHFPSVNIETIMDDCFDGYTGTSFNYSVISGLLDFNEVNVKWEFGDGTFSNSEVLPLLHNYTSPGVYNINLIITSNSSPSCVSVDTYIHSLVDIDFEADKEIISSGDEVTFTYTGSDNPSGYYYTFDYGDGTIETYNDDANFNFGPGSTVSHVYNNVGHYTVTLTIFGSKFNVICMQTIDLYPCELDLTATSTNESAQGFGDGSINLNVSGGIPPYYYNWFSLPSQNTYNTEDLSGLSAGQYYVTVVDSKGCSLNSHVIINDHPCDVSDVSISSTSAGCEDVCNGTATVTAPNGYTFLWDNGATTSAISQLCENIQGYWVTITDVSGCLIAKNAVIENSSTIGVVLINSTNPPCKDQCLVVKEIFHTYGQTEPLLKISRIFAIILILLRYQM